MSGKVEKVVTCNSYLISRAVEFNIGQGRVRCSSSSSSSSKMDISEELINKKASIRPYLKTVLKTLTTILGGNFLLKRSPFPIGKSNASHQEVKREPFFIDVSFRLKLDFFLNFELKHLFSLF